MASRLARSVDRNTSNLARRRYLPSLLHLAESLFFGRKATEKSGHIQQLTTSKCQPGSHMIHPEGLSSQGSLCSTSRNLVAQSPNGRHAYHSLANVLKVDFAVDFFPNPATSYQQGIAVLSLNRPEARNAIGRVFLSQLLEHLHALHSQISQKPSMGPRVLVVSSSVPGVFSAGADLKERRAMSVEQAESFVDTLRDTFALLEQMPTPTIAAIEGLALGGGLELALACDLRVCGSSAQMALPETALAIIPGAGGTQRLPRLVGRSLAKELIFTGRRVGAEEAEQKGLVNAVASDGGALQLSLGLARTMLEKGPLALIQAKQAIDSGGDLSLRDGMSAEKRAYLEVLNSEDRLEGLRAFSEKRVPAYRGC